MGGAIFARLLGPSVHFAPEVGEGSILMLTGRKVAKIYFWGC